MRGPTSSPPPRRDERLPDEHSIIDRFFRPLAGAGSFELRDDAAKLIPPPGCDLVVTADMIASGVHFLPGDPADTIARKALRVNLSDLAAKGARPLAYVISAGFTADIGDTWLAAFAQGLAADHRQFGVALLGGDTITLPEGPVISITAFGAAPTGRMVHRFGGRAGDALYVSGSIGAAAVGLAILKREAGPWDALAAGECDALVGRYRVPEPRVALASALAEFASAAMDVSDGLVGDCDKLAAASGCSAVIEAECVPLPGLFARTFDDRLLARLLTAGDDYEILAAVPPETASAFEAAALAVAIPVARIGLLAEGEAPTKVLREGRQLSLTRRSWVHGRGEGTG